MKHSKLRGRRAIDRLAAGIGAIDVMPRLFHHERAASNFTYSSRDSLVEEASMKGMERIKMKSTHTYQPAREITEVKKCQCQVPARHARARPEPVSAPPFHTNESPEVFMDLVIHWTYSQEVRGPKKKREGLSKACCS